VTAAMKAPPAERQELNQDTPDHGWAGRDWPGRQVTAARVVIDLTDAPTSHGWRNAWVVSLSALFYGTLSAAKIRFVDWDTTATTDSVRTRVAIVQAIVALVLTPLVVGVFLTLPNLATRLLRRLRLDKMVAPADAGVRLDEFAADLQHRFNRIRAWVVVPTALYLAYLLIDNFMVHSSWRAVRLLDLEKLTLSPPQAVLLNVSMVAQAAIFYVAVTALSELWSSSQAFGRLLRDFKLQVQLLHPDGCGGLRVIGRLLNLVLHVAAIFGAAGVCIFLALHGTPWVATRRPEPYVLVGFYLVLLPSAFTLLWRPHVLMDKRRDEILKPLAKEFNATILASEPQPADDAAQLRAHGDRLQELSRQLKLLDDACPAWPLRLRRLRPVVVTAVLPVVISVLAGIMSKLTAG
jgi:hypothetical protein